MTSTHRGQPTQAADPVQPDGDGVSANRVRFLTAEPVEPGRVRNPIFESWRRSRDLKVAADDIEMSYIRDPDMDTPLTRAAAPVLRSLRQQLDGQPVSIILTDPTGLVLSRETGDRDLERHLDRVLLAPGFSYAEKFVGTNGIGTALEMGGPAMVFGHEHYAEDLEDLACAGIPIHDPISGRTVGAIDLTCWRRDAGSLLLALAKATADQIRHGLLADTGAKQLELFQEYLRTCHRMTGAVFALNGDVVMSNDYARTVLDPTDQAALLAQATEALAGGQRGSVVVDLPTGTAARLYYRPVHGGGQPVGVVAHVKPCEAEIQPTGDRHGSSRMQLPGLVGTAAPWLRACQDVEAALGSSEWLAVEGEPGVGKSALLQAVHRRLRPEGRFVCVDAVDAATDPSWLSDVRRALLDADSLVVRHVDKIDAARLRALRLALQDANGQERKRPLWVAVTLGYESENPELTSFLRLFPSTIEVPPLRRHMEDLPALVSFFIGRIGHHGQLVCSAEAMRLLMRSSWPGNAEQVHQMLRQVVKHRRTGSIQPSDLPPEAWTVSRRLLSPLECMERDAIVQCLLDGHGNKAEAARSLGMSRATIYRKIREYGVMVTTA